MGRRDFDFSELYVRHLHALIQKTSEILQSARAVSNSGLEQYCLGQLKGIDLCLEALDITARCPEMTHSPSTPEVETNDASH